MHRRRETWGQTWEDGAAIPEPVLRWQEAVHDPGIYDLEVDTGQLSPVECGTAIARHLQEHPAPSAFARLAEAS
jgi:chloramphenicol 3-O phosphotransferase